MAVNCCYRSCLKSNQLILSVARFCSSQSQSSSPVSLPPPIKISTLKCSPRKLDFSKNPILVYHGLFGSSNNWHSLGKALAERTERPVYALDARNHGSLSQHSDEMSYPAMVSDALEIMNKKKLNQATLIGHSLGGRAFMQFASTLPDRVEKLVIVDIGLKKPTSHHDYVTYIKAMRDAIAEIPAESSRAEAKKIIDHKLKSVVIDPFIRGFLLLNLVETEDKKIAWRLNLDALEKALNEGLVDTLNLEGTYEGQTLLIYGGKSQYVDDDQIVELKKYFPNLQAHCVKDGNHYLHVEKASEFLDTTSKFINS